VKMLDRRFWRAHIEVALDGLYGFGELGGTAGGEGLNAHPEFQERGRRKIAELTGLGRSGFASQTRFTALSRHEEIRVCERWR